MAITQKELDISNISYTNKDFGAIYTELLTLAKKLSYKFDPTSTNESDPFIILLKLLAFVGDKINYNIDKNTLERFLLSATQERSVKELTDTLGYHMHYYKSATTEVVFKCNKNLNIDDSVTQNVTIPAFTAITDSNNTTQYVTLSNAIIDAKLGTTIGTVKAIQGELNTLKILDSETITDQNLDENNRVYFSELYVAQNGVFITSADNDYKYIADEWTQVDQINNDSVYGTKIYSFGFNSYNQLPYIEFPEWFSQIVGNGIKINYLVTKGANGNLTSKALCTISSTTVDLSTYSYLDDEGNAQQLSTTDISVYNPSAITNGQDIETINETYEGFKKTICTFDTLVTCRDYANYIYNMLDNNEYNMVSNAQVGDRRTDINYSLPIASYNEKGAVVVNKPATKLTDEAGNSTGISAYDLCLYPLAPTTTSTDATRTVEAYNKGFKGVTNPSDIIYQLEDAKTISHDYLYFKENDIYTIKNYYKLNCVIYTSDKVNTLEQEEIIKNVRTALATKFGARQVDFGYEIAYDELVEVIQSADSRIKFINLYEPDLETKAVLVSNEDNNRNITFKDTEVPINNTLDAEDLSDTQLTLTAKNIVAGRISLFNYEDTFNYSFNEAALPNGESSLPCEDNVRVKSFTSRTNINNIPVSLTSGYKLLENEAIQFITDSYITTQTYPYGINYYLELGSASSSYSKVRIVDAKDITWDATNKTLKIKWTCGTETKEISYGGSVGDLQLIQLSGSTYEATKDDIIEQNTNVVNVIKIANSTFQLLARFTNSCIVINYPSSFNDTDKPYISANTDYKLATNDLLILQWTNSEGQSIAKKYTAGDIIQTNFDMYTTAYRVTPRQGYSRGETPLVKSYTINTVTETRQFFSLGTYDEVYERKLNQQIFDTGKYVYWHMKNLNNNLIFTKDGDLYKCLIDDEEQLFICNRDFTSLYSFGSGTKITTKKVPQYDKEKNIYYWAPKKGYEKVSSLSLVVEDGLIGIKDYFQWIDFTNTVGQHDKELIATEQNIVTLITDDEIKVTNKDLPITDNTFTPIDNDIVIYYRNADSDDWTQLTSKANFTSGWEARALLDVYAGPALWQTLLYGQTDVDAESIDHEQSITFDFITWNPNSKTWEENSLNPYKLTATKNKKIAFKFNLLKQLGGGENISLSSNNLLTTLDTVTFIEYPIIYAADISNQNTADSGITQHETSENYFTATIGSTPLKLQSVNLSNCIAYFMIFNNYSNDALTITNAKLWYEDTPTTSTIKYGLGVYRIEDLTSPVIITNTSDISQSVTISNIRFVRAYTDGDTKLPCANSRLGLSQTDDKTSSDVCDKLINKILALESNENIKTYFNVINYTNNTTCINDTFALNTPTAYFDVNNIANMWVIPQIDFTEDITHKIAIAQNCKS